MLWPLLQPSGRADEWPTKLLIALAKLSAYGEPDVLNGLLWQKVLARGDGGPEHLRTSPDSVIRVKEVYTVLEALKEQGRTEKDLEDSLL